MASPTDATSSPGRRPARLWSWFFLACVLLFAAAVRVRLREMPLERDEGEFAYGGQLMLQGSWPGHSLYTLKLPGTHAAYAVWMALFGQDCAGVHLGLMLVNCATIVLLFLLTRALVGNLAAGTAAATYALTSLSGDVLGTSAHATHLVVFFAVAGLLWLWHAARSGRLLNYLAAGFCLGSSVLMKHNGLLFGAFGMLWLVWLGISKEVGATRPVGKATLSFLAGAAIPLLVLLLILWRTGTLENTWLWSVKYAQAYAKPNPGPLLIWLSLMQRMPAVLGLPFYTALAGLALLWIRRGPRSAALFATGFLVFSLAAVVPGLHFRPHYYVMLMPAVAFLCGALIQHASELLSRGRLKWLAPVPALAAAGFLAWGVAREQNLFFRLSPVEACRALYGFQPFPEALVLADYIRAHSLPGARIAVLGSEPEIYFHARRRSATGYVYTYPLTENQPFAARMRAQMREEIAATQPQFIVQARSWTSWLSRPGGQKRMDELCAFLMPPHYRLVAVCEFFPDEARVAWHWPPGTIPERAAAASELRLFGRLTATPSATNSPAGQAR